VNPPRGKPRGILKRTAELSIAISPPSLKLRRVTEGYRLGLRFGRRLRKGVIEKNVFQAPRGSGLKKK
jgi:hypothetical protein